MDWRKDFKTGFDAAVLGAENKTEIFNEVVTDVEDLLKKFSIEAYSRGYKDAMSLVLEIIELRRMTPEDMDSIAKANGEKVFLALKKIL